MASGHSENKKEAHVPKKENQSKPAKAAKPTTAQPTVAPEATTFAPGGDAAAAKADADAKAKAAAEIAKRKPYVENCQSCLDWANGYTNTLPCGHDKKA